MKVNSKIVKGNNESKYKSANYTDFSIYFFIYSLLFKPYFSGFDLPFALKGESGQQ